MSSVKTCRLCLKEIFKYECITITKIDVPTSKIVRKLHACVPEISMDLIKESAICNACAEVINNAYNFKSTCLQSQSLIVDYIMSISLNNTIEPIDSLPWKSVIERKSDSDTKLKDILRVSNETSSTATAMPSEIPTDILKVDGTPSFHIPNFQRFAKPARDHVLSVKTLYEKMTSNASPEEVARVTAPKAEPKLTIDSQTVNPGSNEDPNTAFACSKKCEINRCEVMFSDKASVTNAKREIGGSTSGHRQTGAKRGGEQRFNERKMSYNCAHCSFGTVWKYNLIRHLGWHTGVKPFQCTVCHRLFSQKVNLAKHARRHMPENNFLCNVCYSNFPSRAGLKRHVEMHINQKLYKCRFCNFSTIKHSDLREHRSVHKDEKPFTCEDCNHKFKRKTSLKKHVLCVHGREDLF